MCGTSWCRLPHAYSVQIHNDALTPGALPWAVLLRTFGAALMLSGNDKRETCELETALSAGAACKEVEARKTRMAAPVSFSRWSCSAPIVVPNIRRQVAQGLPRVIEKGVFVATHHRLPDANQLLILDVQVASFFVSGEMSLQ